MTKMHPVETNYAGDKIKILQDKWSFSNQEVVDNFSTHIRRSVPLYDLGRDLLLQLSDHYTRDFQKKITCYDLGCSLGELTYKLAKRHQKCKNLTWVGIDQEANMIDRARERHNDLHNLEYMVSDITTFNFSKSSFIVCYYILQFLSFNDRIKILEAIYQCLEPGGCVVIFEKVFADHAQVQELFSSLYIQYKINNHYTASEILKKKSSLHGVLNSLSSKEYSQILTEIGFKKQQTIMKYLCFEGMLAIK